MQNVVDRNMSHPLTLSLSLILSLTLSFILSFFRCLLLSLSSLFRLMKVLREGEEEERDEETPIVMTTNHDVFITLITCSVLRSPSAPFCQFPASHSLTLTLSLSLSKKGDLMMMEVEKERTGFD